jgi:hypothetical protein
LWISHHYVLLYVRRQTNCSGGRVWCIDPLQTYDCSKTVESLIEFLHDFDGGHYELVNRQSTWASRVSPSSSWSCSLPGRFPKQMDTTSCGVFVLAYLEEMLEVEKSGDLESCFPMVIFRIRDKREEFALFFREKEGVETGMRLLYDALSEGTPRSLSGVRGQF